MIDRNAFVGKDMNQIKAMLQQYKNTKQGKAHLERIKQNLQRQKDRADNFWRIKKDDNQ